MTDTPDSAASAGGFAYDSYSGEDGARRFAEIARGFDFGPHLPRADFPPDFVAAYVHYFTEEEDWTRTHFLARYPNGSEVVMLDSIDDPAHIHSQNAILSESIYADPGAVILPPGWVSFGQAADSRGYLQLLVNLDPASEFHGRINVWRRSHDPLGEGDNTQAMGEVAQSLQDFLDGLAPEDAF